MVQLWLFGSAAYAAGGREEVALTDLRLPRVVAYLALCGDRRPAKAEVRRAIWGSSAAEDNLRRAVRALRAHHPELAVHVREERRTIGFEPSALHVDVTEFARLRQAEQYEDALKQVRGGFLDDLPEHLSAWVDAERRRWNRQVAHVCETLAFREWHASRRDAAIDLARRCARLRPSDQAAAILLATYLAAYGDGDEAEATLIGFRAEHRSLSPLEAEPIERAISDVRSGRRLEPPAPGGAQSRRLTERQGRLDVPASDARRSPASRAGANQGAQGARVIFNLPVVVASFTGREDLLEALDATLRDTESVVITQAIVGLGGVGKTQLAARYAQLRADRYDIVAWIRGEDGGVADLAALAERLGVDVDALSPSNRAQAALDRLAANAGRQSWMLVLDNVQSPADLDSLLPRAGFGHVLVTSRDRALREFAPVLAVDVFDEDTATAYLTERTGRLHDADGARSLARALGCLPLALSHAAAYCQDGTSFGRYLELLGELPARDLFDSHPEVSYSQTVSSTWKASVSAAAESAALAGDILAMAACLAPDAIPKTLFYGLVDAGIAIEGKRLADAFNAIARFSLAALDDDTLSMHRLLQRTIREEGGGDVAMVRALDALWEAFPRDARTPASWAWAERLLPHALALAESLPNPGRAGRLVELLNRASWYLNNAEPGSRRSVAISRANDCVAERLLDADHPERMMARNHLATALQWAGQFDEAIVGFGSVLADRSRVLGSDHEHTLISGNNLALALEDAGRSEDAIEIYEKLLSAQERIFGVDDPRCAFTRHNLALSYKTAGRVGDAIAILEPLLVARERTLGAENPETLKTRHHLAAAYRVAGRPEAAIDILEHLLGIRERILGAEHPHTLMTRLELGSAYCGVARAEEAIVVLQRLVPNCQRLLGNEHPDTLAARNSLGVALMQAGRVDGAARTLEAVLSDREQILGVKHRDTQATRNDLAAARRRAKQHAAPPRPPC